MHDHAETLAALLKQPQRQSAPLDTSPQPTPTNEAPKMEHTERTEHTEDELQALAEKVEALTLSERDMHEIALVGAAEFRAQATLLRAGEVEAVIKWLEAEAESVEATIAELREALPAASAAEDAPAPAAVEADNTAAADVHALGEVSGYVE
jgi:hypothetical protein